MCSAVSLKKTSFFPRVMFVADCAVDGGIYSYALSEDGDLTELSYTKEDRPMYLTVQGDRLHAVLLEGSDGNSATVSYMIGDNGLLGERSQPVSTRGVEACHISVLDGRVYTANYASGSLCIAGDRLVRHSGFGPDKQRQEAAHCHYIAPSPDGKYLLAVDLGNDTVFTYDKRLNELFTAKVPLGHGCRHLAYSQNGRYVYCVNELASTVSVFEYQSGRLTLCETCSALPAGFDGYNKAAAVRVSGDYLYVSNRGHNSIVSFRIKGNSLERICFTDCGGVGPRDFNICSDLLVCANEDSGNLTFFRIDCGILTKLPTQVKLIRPLCVVFK